MPKKGRLTSVQQTALMAAHRVYPAASFKATKQTRIALVDAGYAEAVRIPLVKDYGIKLNAHGLRFVQTGYQIGDKEVE